MKITNELPDRERDVGIVNDKDYRHGEHCPLRWPCLDCGLPGGVEHGPDDVCRNQNERCNCDYGVGVAGRPK